MYPFALVYCKSFQMWGGAKKKKTTEIECEQCTSTINNDVYLPHCSFIFDNFFLKKKKKIIWKYKYQRFSTIIQSETKITKKNREI